MLMPFKVYTLLIHVLQLMKDWRIRLVKYIKLNKKIFENFQWMPF